MPPLYDEPWATGHIVYQKMMDLLYFSYLLVGW
jgi:hypothetical protein